MKGFEAINRMLVSAGVESVFQYMAEDTMELMSDMVKNWHDEISVVHSRHEQGAMAMADGYSRSGNRIGVCIVGRGPGIAQTGTALVNARKNRSRLLAISPTPALGDAHDSKFFEQHMYLKSTVEQVITIESDSTLVDQFSEALRRTYLGESPLAVQIPKDVLNSTMSQPPTDSDLRFRVPTDTPGTGPRRRSIDPQTGVQLVPDSERIETAVDLYLDSDAYQPPVILVGRGAIGAVDEITSLADRLNAVLITSLKGIDLFKDHPYAIGFSGNWGDLLSNEFLTDASYVLAVGASLNNHTVDKGYLLNEDVTIVHIDRDPLAIGRFTPVDLGIVGDAAATVSAIDDALETAGIHRGDDLWTDDLAEQIAEYSALDLEEYPEKEGIMDPRDVMKRLEEVLPASRLVAADGGCFRRWVLHELTSPPNDSLVSCDFGAIGLGLPSGIGAAQYIKDGGDPGGEPDDRTPITICGDGGFLMSVQELETAARHQIPMTIIVGNDSSLGSEYHHLAVRGYDPDIARIETPSIAAVAEAFGAEGHVARSLDDIDAVADRLQQPDGPVVLECIIDHEVRHHSY